MLTDEFARYFAIFHNQFGFLHNQIFRTAAKYPLYGLEAGCAALREAFGMARQALVIAWQNHVPCFYNLVILLYLINFNGTFYTTLIGKKI
ncbi:MAG: hypothetical protein GX119_10920 [Syntrophomonadaceae bacterium]|nr:hypothetical protein [Syntrophomonadaceae bacterium]